MATFSIQGPFELPFEKAPGGWKLHYKDFFGQSDELTDLSTEVGIYVFAIRAGKGFTPLYVGKAAKSFKQECFNASNKHKYHDALTDYAKGSPVMFFVVHPQQKGKVNEKEIDQIETYLIQAAVLKNPELQNRKKTSQEKWKIAGVTSGKPGEAAKKFSQTLGL